MSGTAGIRGTLSADLSARHRLCRSLTRGDLAQNRSHGTPGRPRAVVRHLWRASGQPGPAKGDGLSRHDDGFTPASSSPIS